MCWKLVGKETGYEWQARKKERMSNVLTVGAYI